MDNGYYWMIDDEKEAFTMVMVVSINNEPTIKYFNGVEMKVSQLNNHKSIRLEKAKEPEFPKDKYYVMMGV